MSEKIIMNEEEAKKALFELNYEYMKHTKEERIKLYDEYRENRTKIKQALINFMVKESC